MFLHPILFQPHPPPHLYLYLYQSKIISFQSIGISNNGISFTTANVIFCLIWNLKKWEEKHFSNRSDQAPIKWYDEIHNSFLVWGCCEANNPMWPDIKATPPTHTHTWNAVCVCACFLHHRQPIADFGSHHLASQKCTTGFSIFSL